MIAFVFRRRVTRDEKSSASTVGAAWFGYQVYVEHARADELEHERGVQERARQRADETIGDVIVELEETPRWNGPGNPTFGVGTDTIAP